MAFKISSVEGLDSRGGIYAFFLPKFLCASGLVEGSIGGSY